MVYLYIYVLEVRIQNIKHGYIDIYFWTKYMSIRDTNKLDEKITIIFSIKGLIHIFNIVKLRGVHIIYIQIGNLFNMCVMTQYVPQTFTNSLNNITKLE